MRKAFLLIWAILLAGFVSGVRINEIMYAPNSAWGGAYNEWIELYNEGNNSVDLSNWKINGNDFDDINISTGNYVVVARKLNDFQNVYGTGILATDGNFVLSNTGGMIILSNGTESWSEPYTNKEADGNGKSLEWTGSAWSESLIDGGTPGQENSKAGFGNDYDKIKINEFLPDPLSNDNEDKPLGEWVELYNPTDAPMDLEGMVIYDKDDSHELYVTDSTTISGTVIGSEGYLVVYRNGDSDFELNNIGYEEVRFFDGYPVNSSNLIDSVSYQGSVEGMSWSKVDGNWYKSTPTLAEENTRVNGCDWEVEVLPKESVFNLGKQVEFDVVLKRNHGEPGILTVRGWIEDIFGKRVKEYRPWTNQSVTTTRTKTYSPNLKEDVYRISFEITEADCQDNNEENNVDSKLIAISPYYKIFDSSLKIEKIYLGRDETAEWGDRVRVKVNIYKGDESKYNVELYAEKDGEIVSKRTKTSAHDKFNNYTLTLPVQLEPNCEEKLQDGIYEMVLTGLEKEDRWSFEIEGIDNELCQEVEGGGTGGKQRFDYKILERPESVKPGEIFDVRVEITGDKEEHDLKVWSYVYRGPKHYSDEKIETVHLGKDEIKIVDLEVEMEDGVEEGDYKFKVKINKDNQKTNKEMTEEINVINEKNQCVVIGENLGLKNESSLKEKLSWARKMKEGGEVVYLSSSAQSFQWLPAMVMGLLVLLSLMLIFKKV